MLKWNGDISAYLSFLRENDLSLKVNETKSKQTYIMKETKSWKLQIYLQVLEQIEKILQVWTVFLVVVGFC